MNTIYDSVNVSQFPHMRDAMQRNVLFLNNLIASDMDDQTKRQKFVEYFNG